VSVILTIVGLCAADSTLRLVTWAAAAVCFIAASFTVWLVEHRRANGVPRHPLDKQISEEVKRVIESLSDDRVRLLFELAKGKTFWPNFNPAVEEFVKAVPFIVDQAPDGPLMILENYRLPVAEYFRDHPER
jgi:hypothetical protein